MDEQMNPKLCWYARSTDAEAKNWFFLFQTWVKHNQTWKFMPLLYILTSKQLLHIMFDGQNMLFQIVFVFPLLCIILGQKKRKREF